MDSANFQVCSLVNDSYFRPELGTLLTFKLKPHLICKRAPGIETLLQPEQTEEEKTSKSRKDTS